jgi:hypothetical protein
MLNLFQVDPSWYECHWWGDPAPRRRRAFALFRRILSQRAMSRVCDELKNCCLGFDRSFQCLRESRVLVLAQKCLLELRWPRPVRPKIERGANRPRPGLLEGDRTAGSPVPQRRACGFLPLPATPAFLARQESLGPPSSAALRPRAVQDRSARRRVIAPAKTAVGAADPRKDITMATNDDPDVPCPIPRRIERVRVSIPSPLTRPSPIGWRVGIRIVTFGACSGFTHVTARRIAQPPKATFVTRLRPDQLPSRTARQPPDQSTTLRVEPSSTSDSRLRGAQPKQDHSGEPRSTPPGRSLSAVQGGPAEVRANSALQPMTLS